jgi:mycofactocin biosynthesis protein MftB
MSRSTACAASTSTQSMPTIDLSRAWAVDPDVQLRPEPFGALAYHFGTRRLSFLKSPVLLRVVEELARQPSAADACRSAGVLDSELPWYEQALATLAQTHMIVEREDSE